MLAFCILNFKEIKMKLTFWKKFGFCAVLLATGTVANYTIYLQSKVGRLEELLKLSDMRSNVNETWANDLTWSVMNNQTKDMLKQQGRIEGLVSAINPEVKDDYSTVWHEGYQRGLDQTEDTINMAEKRAYEEGYKRALEKAGKTLEKSEIIPPGKPIIPRVIKQPDFDEKTGKLLKDNEELRKELNDTAKRQLDTQQEIQKAEEKSAPEQKESNNPSATKNK